MQNSYKKESKFNFMVLDLLTSSLDFKVFNYDHKDDMYFPIEEKKDIELIARYATSPKCDTEEVNRTADSFGERGIIRGHICCFDVYGQPGTWQDATCLVGTEKLIMETFDDPAWVHELLKILQARKKIFTASLAGARYDILELGGGSASSTVISPEIFNEFVAPYDKEIIELAHKAGQRIAYHTCGGMMLLLGPLKARQEAGLAAIPAASAKSPWMLS